MIRGINRLLLGAGFAIPAALLSFVFVGATPSTEPVTAQDTECQTCHKEFMETWLDGNHSKSVSDPIFLEAWEVEGKQGTCLTCHATGFDVTTGLYESGSVDCKACHSPIPAQHPAEPMPADRSGQLCGECHTETYFEWQVSQHRQTDLTCVDCHDPHATWLKADQASTLCANCHRGRSSNFAHTQHASEGLTCADCHLGDLEGEIGEGRAKRAHTFQVQLTTCNACHAFQMHDPVDVHVDPVESPPDAMASGDSTDVTESPDSVSPVGFAAITGLIGMASGMILAPWLERFYRRMNQEGE
jgi:hypothetical protein